MKNTKLMLTYNAEKLSAIEEYASKKGVDLMAEIDETIGRVYEKCVPTPVREFIEIKQRKEEEAKAKAKASEKAGAPLPTPTPPNISNGDDGCES